MWSKACSFNFTKAVASTKKRLDSLVADKESQMFILNSHEMNSAMFAKSTKADTNIERAMAIFQPPKGQGDAIEKELSSNSLHSKRKILKEYVKLAKSANNIGTHS